MKKLDNTIIVGIGNNTRQDDGLGWSFLDALTVDGFNEKNLLYKYQLMVEDAELISTYKTVFFVDAIKTEIPNGFAIEQIYPSEQVSFSTHEIPPNQLLNLCMTIYNKKPVAYLVKIQGFEWDFKIELTKNASKNLNKSLSYFYNFASEILLI